ncbi:MAG: gamma-glutamyltransferase [Planctomycetota bacterium JB042]
MKIVLVAPLLVALVPSLALGADRITGRAFATRSEVIAPNGMAATSQPRAPIGALAVLKAGGSAVDAAIAANAVLALTEPTGCGLGGDLFAIVWDAETGTLRGLNGSGRSPRGMTLEWLRAQGIEKIPPRGPLPVTIPGCVDGWFTLHEAFGALPMRDLLAPAIRYARDGFPVSEVIAHYWRLNARVLREYDGFEEQFTIDGRTPETGEMFRNPNLARTLERLAAGGRDAFYEGEIARAIAGSVARAGGFLSVEDLAAHRSEWVDPVSTDYRGVEVWELPPNGQGIAALQMLNVLEGYDVAAWGFGSVEHLHHLVEAKKLAFEDRARLYADPAFHEIPVARLISKEYAAARRETIGDRAARVVRPGIEALEEGDTIYLCTADADGNMVSLIQSNYRGMGSGICPDDLGFILQDRGELFDLTPGRFNTYAPGKRPFHTIIPAFATRDGKPWLAFGVMGGATQPQAHAQIVLNLVDFGMNLQEAGDAPRLVHSGSSQPTGERMDDGGTVALESGFPVETRRDLAGRGHVLQDAVGIFGGYQAIAWDPEHRVYRGASESRKDGMAAGY